MSTRLLGSRVGRVFGTVELLTRRTMAVFRIQWLFPAQLVLDLAAMTAGFIASVKVWIVVMDLVGCSKLPLIVLAFSSPLITIVAISAIRRRHSFSTHVGLENVDAKERSGCWTDGTRCETEVSGL